MCAYVSFVCFLLHVCVIVCVHVCVPYFIICVAMHAVHAQVLPPHIPIELSNVCFANICGVLSNPHAGTASTHSY